MHVRLDTARCIHLGAKWGWCSAWGNPAHPALHVSQSCSWPQSHVRTFHHMCITCHDVSCWALARCRMSCSTTCAFMRHLQGASGKRQLACEHGSCRPRAARLASGPKLTICALPCRAKLVGDHTGLAARTSSSARAGVVAAPHSSERPSLPQQQLPGSSVAGAMQAVHARYARMASNV